MNKLIAIQQIYFDHYRTHEFRKRILSIMIQLAKNDEVVRCLNEFLVELLKYNRAYKRRSVCRVTSRARASTQKFNMTRMGVRTFGKAGFLPGLTKASW